MWKNDREKMYSLRFCDSNNSINLSGEIKNPSYMTLTFNKETYEDLKACIPAFLKYVGYKFTTNVDDGLTLVFEPVTE